MSERKTSEIKFRCTPSFKAEAQAAADAAGLSLTEHIEAAVRSHRNVGKANGVVGGAIESVWARQNAQLDSTNLAANAIGSVPPKPCEASPQLVCDCGGITECPNSPRQDSAAVGAPIHPNLQPAEPPPPLRPNTCGCKPWEFCACKANA